MYEDFRAPLTRDAELVVYSDIEQGRVVGFRVLLLVGHEGKQRVVRLYDTAHGEAHMHRYDPDGTKHDSEPFPAGTLEQAKDEAIRAIIDNYEEMIDSWRRR